MDEEEERKPFDISKSGAGGFVGGAATLSVLRTTKNPFVVHVCFSMLFASQPHIAVSFARLFDFACLHGRIQQYKRLFLYVNQTKKSAQHFTTLDIYTSENFVFVFMKRRKKSENCYAKNPLIVKRRSN